MNKEAYMSELRAALEGFDADLAQEIVEDYEERFRIGTEKGLSEEEIIRELGSIENLVAELGEMQNDAGSSTNGAKTEQKKEDYSGGSTYQDKSFSESFESIMKKVGKAVDGAMKEAGKAIEGAMEQVGIRMEEAKRNRYYTYDGATAYEGSERENTGEPNVEQSGQGDGSCCKVVLDAEFADVKVRPVRENEPKAVCHYFSHKSAMMYPFYAYQEGDTFYVGIRRNQQGQESKSGFFQFSMSPSIEIELLIPEGMEEIEAISSSGDMEFTEIRAEKLNLRSKSGNIVVGRLEGRECHMEAMSGNLALEKSNVREAGLSTKSGDCTVGTLAAATVTVNTASGDLNIHGIQAESVVLNTMSGDMENDDIQAEALRISTASGDVEVRYCRGRELYVNTASGDIDINADYKNYQVKSQSGDVELESRHDADVIAHSTSGDVEIRMVETEAAYNVEMHSVSGECVSYGQRTVDNALVAPENTRVIEAKTISGDINVKFL